MIFSPELVKKIPLCQLFGSIIPTASERKDRYQCSKGAQKQDMFDIHLSMVLCVFKNTLNLFEGVVKRLLITSLMTYSKAFCP